MPALQQRRAFGRGTCTPRGPGAISRLDGTPCFDALQGRHLRQRLAGGRVADGQGGTIVSADPLPIDVGAVYQQAGVFQLILEHDRVLFRDDCQSRQTPQSRMLKER